MSLAQLFYMKETFRASVRRWRQACFRKRTHARREQRFTLEALEPRLLLDASPLLVNMEALGHELTVHVQNDGATSIVQLLDMATATVVASQNLADTSEINFIGSDANDALTIDQTAAMSGLSITFAGGLGDDTVFGPSGDTLWSITGPGAGNVGSLTFNEVEQLRGAADNKDTFVLEATGSVSGVIDGGSGGRDMLDYSGYTTKVSVDLATGTATGALGFLSIEKVKGGSADDVLKGPAEHSTWTINGVNSGTVGRMGFSGMKNLAAGSGDDTFVMAGGVVSGTISGGEGIDTLDYSAATTGITVDLSAGAATSTSGISGIESVLGGVGNDTLVGADTANTWQLIDADAGTLNGQGFSSVENLTGGAGNDMFLVADGGSLSGAIEGGAGDDTLIGPDIASTWTIAAADGGTLNGLVFSGVENLTGGADNDTFQFTASGSLSGMIQGGGGSDTLFGADIANIWRLTGANAGTLNGQAFASIENLVGGAEQDAFIFFAGGSVSGTIDGGAGDNVFDYSALATDVTVDLATGTATATGGVANVSGVVGGAGSDTLVGPATFNTWTITSLDAGIVGRIRFSGVENLTGGALNDTFVLTGDGRLSGTLSGGPGDDTLVGPNKANTWEVTDADAGRLNGAAFSETENLLGGAIEDTFIFGMVGRLSGVIDGRAGVDRVRGADKRNRWKITGSETAKLDDTSLSGVEQLKGGADQDELVGPDADTTWSVTGPDAGDVAGISFSGIENLTGAADNKDTFVIENGGSISGVVDGGAGGFDSLKIAEGGYSTIISRPTGPDSGSISLDGTVVKYAGLEPVVVDSDAGANVVFDLTTITGGDFTLDWFAADNFTLTENNGAMESHTFADPGAGGTVTINLGSGNDTIKLQNLLGAVVGTTLNANVIISGGAGDDTYVFDDKWGPSVTLKELVADTGTDVLNFAPYSDGGNTIAIAPQVSGDIVITGVGDGSALTLDATAKAFDDVVNAEVDLTGSLTSVKAELVDGLKKIVAFMRNLAASGDFLTDLPVIGKNADVTISKALNFAEALDEIRFQVEEYFDGLPTLTTQDLIDFLNDKFQAGVDYVGPLKHLGAAILAAKPIADANIVAADQFDFKLTLDGVVYHVKAVQGAAATASYDEPTKTVTVGFVPLTVDALLTAVNFAISSVDDLAGQIGAAVRDGRLAFQVVSTEIDEFKLGAGNALDAAATKLGLNTTETPDFVLSNVQEILNGLGDLNVSLGTGVTLAVSFEGGVPKIRFDVDYRADRTSDFFYNFGPEAQSLGLGFDIHAKILAMAELVADFQLGLGLGSASTADFFLDVDALRAGVSLTAAAVTGVDLNLGFLGLEANGTLALEAGLTASPATLATLQNVTDPSLIDASAFGLMLTGGDGTGSPNFDIDLTLTVDAGTSDIGFVATGTLTASGDPFDGSGIVLNTDASFDANFPDFNNLNAAGVVSLLGQLGTWLDGVRQSDAISSLDIPFVEGGLEKILDLAEVLSDALLFDEGPDDIRDGANKLVTDLNQALGDAGLDRLIRAEGNGTSITLVEVDPRVTEIKITKKLGINPDDGLLFDGGGFANLGFVNATSAGTPDKIVGTAAVLLGKLTGRAGFTVEVKRTTATGTETITEDVSLEASATADNKGIGDDKPKLLDAGNAPTFANTQEFADRLSEIITLGLVHYDVTTKILTLDIDFDDVQLFSVELPTDFKLNLGSIVNVQSNTHLIIDATGGLNLTLGFDLSESPAGSSALTDGTTLADDSDALTVNIKKEEALTADTAPRTIVGQLSGDANFTITYNPTVDVTVPKLIGQTGTDINVTQRAGDQSETAIAVNPDNIIIGANDLNTPTIDSVWVTHDGGGIWNIVTIPNTIGGNGNSAGDPALIYSRDGSVVIYTHMIEKTNGDTAIVAVRSTDGGDTWIDERVIGSLALDEDGDTFNDNNDKNYIAVGPRDASHLNQDRFIVTWQRNNVIYASTSLDGLIWTAPVVVGGLLAGSSTAAPSGSSIDAIPSFGPNGEIYVAWEDFGNSNDGLARIKFDSSLDGGLTWGGGHDAKVLFATDESVLTNDDKAILDTFAAVMKADPLLIATIAGYTDAAGDPGPNQTLSLARANAVNTYLTVTLPVADRIAASRLTVLGFGEQHQAVATADGVAKPANRRVELTLDRVIYTGSVNVFRDPFMGGLGLDGVDETTSPLLLGEYEIPGQDTRGIWMGLSMDVDLSGSVREGRIYLAFTDQGDLDGNAATGHHNTDIFVIASDDFGVTWTALALSPDAVGADQVRVNDDLGTASQWFSWLDVDQSTGALAISWYDTRNDTGVMSVADNDVLTNTGVQYFASISRDFGLTWDANLQVSNGTSNVSAAVAGASTAANQFGDYSGLAFTNSTIYMAWADNSNSTADHVPAWPASRSTEVYFDTIPLTNNTIDDLLADINAVIANAPLLAGKFEAQALPDSKVVRIVAIDPSITSFTVTVPNNSDPAFRDLGFQLTAAATVKDGDLFVAGAKNAPTLVGQLTADASFDMTLDGVTKTITVKRADTVSSAGSNHNILDLVSDVQKAINKSIADGGFGPGKIDVSSAGGKLLFTRLGTPALGTSDSFIITPGTNAAELGITSTLTSDEADLVITTSDGVKHRITLDSAANIGDVISAINLQTGGSITASKTVDDPNGDPTPVNEANTSLTLVDNTFPGGTPFIVAAANGSQAGIQLGIIGMDDSPVNPDDVADGKIVGATIAGATLLDRFFITSDDLSSVIDANVSVSAGVVVKDISVLPSNKITSSSFKFKAAQAGKQIQIKGVSGFSLATFTINSVNETTNEATLNASPGAVGLVGGVGLLKTGVQASANFGFVGISLDGSADVGATLTLGFDTNAPELADSKLTLQELVNAIKDGQVLDLLAIPDLVPLSPATNFGEVDLKLGLSAGGGDLTGLATTLFGAGDPRVEITLVTFGDPFIDTRFDRANYNQTSAATFVVDGDFTTKLPDGVTLRFTDVASGKSHELVVASTAFVSGKTTVTVTADAADPFDLPIETPTVFDVFSVTLLPKIDILTPELGDLPDLSDLSFADIIAALQALSNFLGQFESFGFLNTDLPIINESVNDLLAFAGDFAQTLDEAQSNPAGSLQVLETKINEAIGISSANLVDIFTAVGKNPVLYPTLTNDAFDLSYDAVKHLLTADFSLGAGFSRGLDMAIPGIDFGGALSALGLDNVLDLSGSAGLKAEGAVLLRLSLGIDVANFDIDNLLDHIFILDTTGLDAKLTVGGEDIAFRVGVGPFALSIASAGDLPADKSKITIAAEADAGLKLSAFTDGKAALSSIDTSDFQVGATGTVTGSLPVFFPNDSTRLGTILIGGSDGSGNFTPIGDLADLLAGGFDIKTQAGAVTADAIVVDVSDVVAGISGFNFDSFNIFDNIFLAIDGIDLTLGFIQDVVGDKIGGLTIPLIGDGLNKAAHFIGDLREDVIAPLRAGIEKAKDAAQDFADADKNIISKLLFDLLGPGGADLLQDRNWDGIDDGSVGDFIDLNTNLDDFLFNPSTTLELKDVFIEWDLALGDTLVNESADIGFDLGIPGLGLKTEGDINLNVEWLLNLGFGLSFMEGFYLQVDDPHELLFDVSVDLSPGTAITGTLGFLGLRAEDKTIDGHATELGATFMVDIFEQGASGDDAKRLGFTEFGQIGFNAGVAAEASASLGLELGLSPELLSEVFGAGAGDVISGFPKIVGDFVFLWEIGTRGSGADLAELADNSTFISFSGIGDAIEDGLKKVAFQDIALDVGSFLSDVLGPIVEEVGKFTGPIQPLIDFVTSPIPIIGQLGLDITWLDLASSLGGFDAGFIESVAEVITLINEIADLSDAGAVMLPIGDMTIFDESMGFEPELWKGGLDLGGTFADIQGISGLLNDVISALPGGIGEALGDLGGEAAEVLGGVVGGESAGGFAFPFLEDPSEIFGLLMGKPARLVTYDLAPLDFNFDFHVFFPIFGPLGVSIGLLVDFNLDTAFGYDTQGIQDFVEGGFRNPTALFNGFYIDDSPTQNGVDDPELTFLAELQAAAELNLGIARAGVAAALGFQIEFDLFDPNEDGRIRISELLFNIENQLKAPSDAEKLLAPLAIFDVQGEIFARMFVFLEIDFGFFSFEKEFPIFGPVTLLSFDVDFFRPPVLASELDNGDLLIHTGAFAEQRLLGNATDVAENLIFQSDGTDGDFVKVKIKANDGALGDDSQVFQDYRVRKGSKIIIDGGEADDIFDLTGFTEDGVIFEIDLGVGNDQVLWNNLAGGVANQFSSIHGGSGDDTINGSGGSDLIFGEAGNDTINAGDGDDLIFGDEGEIGDNTARGLIKPTDGGDTIEAGGGKDIVFGGGGKDLIKGGIGADPDLLIGGGGLVTFNSPKVFSNVKSLVQGGVTETENLIFDSTAGDTIEGGDGDDLLFGTGGPDIIKGEGGKDTILGMAGFDTIDAGSGDDIVFGDGGKLNPGAGGSGTATGGNATTLTDSGAQFLIDGVKIGDYVRNDTEAKFVRVIAIISQTTVQTEAVANWNGSVYSFFVATPVPGGHADKIQGGAGNDMIFGGDGGDFIAGGVFFAGADPGVLSGSDQDEIFGGSGPDVVFGDNVKVDGTGNLLLVMNKPVISGDGADRIFGEGEPDKLFGGGGFDLLDGGAGADVLKGGDGADTLLFNKGSDRLDGEDGGDSYFANFQGGTAVSLVIAQDSGTSGTDLLAVNGTVFDDLFLLRANTAGTDAFIAMIKDNFFVERINYGGTLERILINGGFGNDYFAIDDTAAEITINGEFGDDTFQVGQIFRSQRTPAAANVSVNPFDDSFATIETTRGFLSNGISEPMTINGGLGNDHFVAFHNKAVLQLNGEGGDDVFEIRAFALAGSQEPQRERTDISGGAGADLVMYVVNAPVNIDGGDGFDTVVIIGTEFGDDFVVTEKGVFGAGLTVSFVNIESLRIDAAEGNDRIFVQSTSEKFITEIFGGLGEDTVFMSGDTPPIVSNDLRGHSGLVLHDVESNDPLFDGQNLFGISANVADNDEPFIVVRPSGGSTIITEGSSVFDEFQLVLTRDPLREIKLFIAAPLPTPSSRERRAQMFRVESPTVLNPADINENGTSITMRFDSSNWFVPQTVHVIADSAILVDTSPETFPIFTRPEIVDVTTGAPPRDFTMDDDAFEGVRFGVVNISVQASVVNHDSGAVYGVNVTKDQITIAKPLSFTDADLIGQNLKIDSGPGFGQNRFIRAVGPGPDASKVILTLDRPYGIEIPDATSVYLIQDDDSIVGKMDSFREDTAQLILDGIIPASTNPNDQRSVFVDADGAFPTVGEGLTGGVVEIVGGAGLGQQRLILGNNATTLILNGGWRTNPDPTSIYRIERYDGLSLPSVSVQVNDNDRPGLIVDETKGLVDPDGGPSVLANVVDDFDTTTALIEGGSGDHLGERDVIQVRLSTMPTGNVKVGLIYDPNQLLVADLSGNVVNNSTLNLLTFSNLDAQNLIVTALVDGLREGFHTSLIQFEIHEGSADVLAQTKTEEFRTFTDAPVFFVGLAQAPNPTSVNVFLNGSLVPLTRVDSRDVNGLFVGGDYFIADNNVVFVDNTGDPLAIESTSIKVTYTYDKRGFLSAFTAPVLARINDFEAPTVVVRETGGSTDVIELRRGGADPDSVSTAFYDLVQAFNASPWNDSYELVLSAQPDDDVIITVSPDITKTTRTGGIRHDADQVEVFNLAADPRVVLETFTANVAGSNATTLIDDDAEFITKGIRIGDLVRSLTEGVFVQVTEIVNETTLKTQAIGSWSGDGYTFGNLLVTFSASNWDDPVQIGVRALDDRVVDGADTQVFAPHPATLSGILGPVHVEGAGGAGSLSLGTPVLLPPNETNLREVDGNVVDFVSGTGFGATEFMTVELADLQAKVAADDLEGDALKTLDDLIGKTIVMARGQGLGVVLNPDRPNEVFDRFWLINAITGTGTTRVLTLQNPSQVDPGALAASAVPTASDNPLTDEDERSHYAITALSANFFVDEKTQVDVIFVHDEDSPADSSGVLTSTRLYGLNMGPDLVIGGQLRVGGITYDDFEVIEVNLGKGNNNLEVVGTHTREDGYQTWTLINTGNETVPFADIGNPSVLEKGDDVILSLNAEDETFTGFVVDAVNANLGLLQLTTTITVDQTFAVGSLQGSLIAIDADGIGNPAADGQSRRIINNIVDPTNSTWSILTVDRPWEFLPNGEAYTITNEADGPIAINLQDGDDELDASNSSLGIVVFGGLGMDNITGGAGDDIIFGDRGRVDYFNEIGAIVTRLGDAPEPITGFVTSQVVGGTPGAGESNLFHIEDTGPKLSGGVPIGGFFPVPDTDGNLQAGTEDIGLKGLYVDINNGFGFLQTVKLIDSNTGTVLTLAEPFDINEDLPGPVLGNPAEYRISTIPEDQTDGVVRAPNLLITVDNDQGGVDTINAGGGKDQIFGGAGGDTINAGANDDIVIGDAGRIDRTVDPAAPATPAIGAKVGSFLDLVRTIDFAQGDDDTINGDAGNDILIGGTEDDIMDGGANADILLGDQGTADFQDGKLVSVKDPGTDGDDILTGGSDPDLIIGGLGNDTIYGLGAGDILIGDAAVVTYDSIGTTITQIETVDRTQGGIDTIYGGNQDDIIIGGTNADNLDGGNDRDLIFGDNVLLTRSAGSGNAIDPRFRALTGTTIYGSDGLAKVAGEFSYVVQPVPGGRPTWGADWTITLDQTLTASHFGDDYIAGGGGNDEIFGQLGDDTIQGDGSIGFVSVGNYAAIGTRVGATRDGSNALLLNPSVEATTTDGDDYIEGNGGNDVIFGNLGQDDIIGGSSNLFSLKATNPIDDRALRPDGTDRIFGGAGTEIARNDAGNTAANGHASDADMIVGDNGNIFRLVSINGSGTSAYLIFNYDNYNTLKIIPRAAQLLDYTPGGPDFNTDPVTHVDKSATDIGAADEIHGESGDDFIYAGKGNDVVFGDGQDDDLIGGYGNDWISGGTGDDGVLGDDGRIFTSRNGKTEPLNGITVAVAPITVATGGNIQTANINVAGELKKSVDITPFSTDTLWTPAVDEWGGLTRKNSDDIIFGGQGNDFLHGGSGDDAISGAEALPLSYAPTYDSAGNPIGLVETDFSHPFNPGNALAFNPIDVNAAHTNRQRAGEFALYDEYDPLRKILLNAGGTASKWTGTPPTVFEFFLNFNATEGPASALDATKKTDGNDKVFGDLGNDWLVGGSGRDDLYGGFGNDLLNADDDLTTAGSLNNGPDTSASYEDRAYGGAGRDVLIANTGGDRLIDWGGEYNSYLVPFSANGIATISRSLQPALQDFLYALSASDGADPTRAADAIAAGQTADATRNGEPWGELGLVLQQDAAWKDQHGGAADPQPGNISGTQRDVLRSANFTNGATQGFNVQVGTATVVADRYQAAPAVLGGDAVSLFNQADTVIPVYFEMQATINAVKPVGGAKANAFLVFDWQSNTNFKFAGIDISTNKLEIGHRTASGWVVDNWTNVQVKAGTDYVILLKANNSTATAIIGTSSVSFTFAARIDSKGIKHLLNEGITGIGGQAASAQIDNVIVQKAPEPITVDVTADFSSTSPASNLFKNTTVPTGTWVNGTDNRFAANTTDANVAAINLAAVGALPITPGALLNIMTTVKTSGMGGVVFDYQGPTYYKYVVLSADSNQILVGHRRGNAWVTDASYAFNVSSSTDYKLGVSLRGGLVNVSINGAVLLSQLYVEKVTDGGYGLISRKGASSGASSFDIVEIKSDEGGYAPARPLLQAATADPATFRGGDTPSAGDLAALLAEAKARWAASGLDTASMAKLDAATVQLADLPGAALGEEVSGTVFVDLDAAGRGWFIDSTPQDNAEFHFVRGLGEWIADAHSTASSRMDLLTTIMHELGHVLGFDDQQAQRHSANLMTETLSTGVRRSPLTERMTEEQPAPGAEAFSVKEFLGRSLKTFMGAWGSTGTGSGATTQSLTQQSVFSPVIDWTEDDSHGKQKKSPMIGMSTQKASWLGKFLIQTGREEAKQHDHGIEVVLAKKK